MNTFPRAEHYNASPLRGSTLTYEFEDSTSNTWILWGAFKPQRVSINILAGFGFLALVGISKTLLAPGAQDHSEMWDFPTPVLSLWLSLSYGHKDAHTRPLRRGKELRMTAGKRDWRALCYREMVPVPATTHHNKNLT